MALRFFRSSLIGHSLWWICKPQTLAYVEDRDGFQYIQPSDSLGVRQNTLETSEDDDAKPEGTGLNDDDSGSILVHWSSPDDQENPQNWPASQKAFVLACMSSYAFVVYMTAPIFVPSEKYFMEEYAVSQTYSSLGLAIYILGYGIGPLVFSPLSEIPAIGRAIPYPTTFAAFILLSIGIASTTSASSLIALRFFHGVFGSPALSTAGATIADIYSPAMLPHAMTSWTIPCYCAPAVGSIIAGFAVPVMGWRFSMWEVCIASAPLLILLCLLPETTTGFQNLKHESEITMHAFTFQEVLQESLLIPMNITFLDPAMLFANVYTSLIYGIYYTFFEALPLVYADTYGFNLGESALTLLAIIVGAVLASASYNAYIYRISKLENAAENIREPEELLIPALFSCFLPPIGLFLFGWASSPHVHWIVPTLGLVIFPAGVYSIMQCICVYVPTVYPRYAASIFAAQDITRCVYACGAVLYARVMFVHLGLGGACSLLAGLMILGIGGMFLLYRFGAALRRRSKFVAKW